MAKLLHTMSGLFVGLEAADHPYTNEQKRLTMVHSLPEDWNQMRFKRIHRHTANVRCQVELELSAYKRLPVRSPRATLCMLRQNL